MTPPDTDIRLLGPNHPDRRLALRMVFGDKTMSQAQADKIVRLVLSSSHRQSLDIDLLLASYESQRICAATLAIISPGRTAILFLGPVDDPDALDRYGSRLLRELKRQVWSRGVVLLQSLVQRDASTAATIHRDAGFDYLTELLYMNRDLSDRVAPSAREARLTFSNFRPECEQQFIETLRQTYSGSLDCPQLSGVRDVRDVMLGHRHTGIYDPDLWFLACKDDTPVGILLMSGLAGNEGLEIVYIGVVAASRGMHMGDALLSLAIDVGRTRGASYLTLAVDVTNTYARDLYARWGFLGTTKRRVWIAINENLSSNHDIR